MTEFCLPDSLQELMVAEDQLREELSRREADLQLVQQNLPPSLKIRKTPAYYAMMVAHRKWQFAYEKLLVASGKALRV